MRKVWITSMILLAFLITFCGKKEEVAAPKPATVQGVKAETIRLSPVEEAYEAVGTVRSKTTSVLSSKTVGHITAVHVHEGDRVRTGQLLIEMDDRDTRAQLQKAQAGLREVQDAQEEMDQNIRAAESAREAAEAGKSLALVTFNRYKALLDERSVSRQEFDEVQAKLRVAEAELNRAGRMLQAVTAKKNQILAKTEQAKADVAGAQVYVGYSRILSPMNGIVTSKQAEVGLLAAPGVPLLTVDDDSHYRLEVSVEETMLRKVRLGMPVLVFIDALGPQEHRSVVTEIVPASDPTSRSYIVKIGLNQPSLRSGLFGKARFGIGQKEILRVSQKAISERGQLVGVWVVDPSNTVRLRLIKTGKRYGDQMEVLSGLNNGDRVIVEGMEKVREGDRIGTGGP